MYLLNLERLPIGVFKCPAFTFHYVSIKSVTTPPSPPPSVSFTFHYVSIKSNISRTTVVRLTEFTFHYVSIKSAVDYILDGEYI